MELGRLKVFGMLTSRMHWLNRRQSVLAQNVANADTPGFVARDLRPLDFDKVLRDTRARLHMAATRSGHLAGQSVGAGGSRAGTEESAVEATPTGNSVILEEEMMKVTDTVADYQLMTNLYGKHIGLIKTAIGRGGRR